MRQAHLRGLFADDPHRAERLSAEAGELFLDYSKHIVTDETIGMLVALAEAAGLRERIDAMFAGERVNVTEDRAALHVALRAPRGARIEVDGHDVVPDVHEVLDRMSAFADRVRTGEWTGATGERMRAVVNIGIGGSDLGPHMAVEALRDRTDRDMTYRFVSNVDGADIAEATRDLDPADDLVHRVVEDVRHDRDAHERAQRPRLAAGRPRRRRDRRRAPLRRGVDRGREGDGVRHRSGEHVRVLGLGRRALLDGFGDRALPDDRDRTGGVPRDARRLPRHRRARARRLRSSATCRC